MSEHLTLWRKVRLKLRNGGTILTERPQVIVDPDSPRGRKRAAKKLARQKRLEAVK